MEISQLSFVLLAIYSVCFGVLLGVAYDVIRIIRVLLGAYSTGTAKKTRLYLRDVELPIIKRKAYPLKKHNVSQKLLNLLVAAGDILFVCACAVMAVLISFAYNSGKVRMVIFVGLLAGFLAYYFTVGRLVMALSELIAFVLRSVCVYLYEFIRMILARIVKAFKKRSIKIKTDKKERSKNDVQQRKRKIETVTR